MHLRKSLGLRPQNRLHPVSSPHWQPMTGPARPRVPGKRRTQEITHVRFRCELVLIILITETTPTCQHSLKTSSAALNSHCVTSQTFILSSHFWNCKKLVSQKGRASGGGLREPALLGEVGERGKIKSPAAPSSWLNQMEGLHGFPYNLDDRIDLGRRQVDVGYV